MNRRPGKFERAARLLDSDPLGSATKWPHQLPLVPKLLVNERDAALIKNEFDRLFSKQHPEGPVEKTLFISSTPDVPSDDAWDMYQRAARRADFMYKWRYND